MEWKYILSFILISILGRSNWPFFCRHVTGSHEDVMWSWWHQFNDVPDFFTVLFPGFPGVFDQHRQRGERGCHGFYIHADLHLGKHTSGRLPLCAAGYILRREETQSVCRNVLWCASSPKNMDLQSLGNLEWTWMQRHSGSHYIVFKAWAKHGVLLIWTAALEPRGLPRLLGVFCPEGFQRLCCRSSSSYIYIHNLFVDYASG